jgi:hypothetical protein
LGHKNFFALVATKPEIGDKVRHFARRQKKREEWGGRMRTWERKTLFAAAAEKLSVNLEQFVKVCQMRQSEWEKTIVL